MDISDIHQPGDIFANIHLVIITKEKESVGKKLTTEQLAEAQQLVYKFIQYWWIVEIEIQSDKTPFQSYASESTEATEKGTT